MRCECNGIFFNLFKCGNLLEKLIKESQQSIENWAGNLLRMNETISNQMTLFQVRISKLETLDP